MENNIHLLFNGQTVTLSSDVSITTYSKPTPEELGVLRSLKMFKSFSHSVAQSNSESSMTLQ